MDTTLNRIEMKDDWGERTKMTRVYFVAIIRHCALGRDNMFEIKIVYPMLQIYFLNLYII